MDTQLKQRLLGATVIVALAVIIVPELAKRPADRGQQAVAEGDKNEPQGSASKAAPNSAPTITFSLPEDRPRSAASKPAPAESAENTGADPARAAPQGEPKHVTPSEAPVVQRPNSGERSTNAADETVAPATVTPHNDEAEAKAEQERQRKAEAEARHKAELAARQKADAEAREKAQADARDKAQAEARQQAEQEARKRAEVETRKKAEAEARARAAAEERQKFIAEETQRKAELAERQQASQAARPAAPADKPDVVVLPRIELVAKSEPQQPAPARETAGYFMVQAGTFAAVEKATELRDRLRARGFNTSLFPVTVDGRPLYRVRVGPQASRAESEQARDRLQRDLGVQGSIVPIN